MRRLRPIGDDAELGDTVATVQLSQRGDLVGESLGEG
jgi:hypothetical protein